MREGKKTQEGAVLGKFIRSKKGEGGGGTGKEVEFKGHQSRGAQLRFLKYFFPLASD